MVSVIEVIATLEECDHILRIPRSIFYGDRVRSRARARLFRGHDGAVRAVQVAIFVNCNLRRELLRR